ncbi:TylF/MycF/NovP-related O-methyltransferase [Methylobacterium sp. NEAU K]|uniref:TylF/MycF/NovP-related O-methyltransferase n=1 Tax=Methylobacterium sp. NEAU K TaxID=3064946 RepID=UPI00273716FF|nr:TylF/MycF/NovP-related O-methyltransferase [Methylobacterium sp. NEAU K]MDP4003270.1 TylF/MycF/NovP-related O-methyltransferase [Methylobacterium sp. NEAU K]
MAYEAMMNRGYLRKFWYPRYQFEYFPRQLCYLASCIERTSSIEGDVVEVGCAHGLTTTFLYEYMKDSGIEKSYNCFDTFSGFTEANISVELNKRMKIYNYEREYKNNNVDWFKESLSRRNITDINVVQADICTIDESKLPSKIAFCLIDVDLYEPVKIGLEKIYPRISAGGIIVVDDCWTKKKHMWVESVGSAYDGAMQAYKEFTSREKLPEKFVETKLAIIEK